MTRVKILLSSIALLFLSTGVKAGELKLDSGSGSMVVTHSGAGEGVFSFILTPPSQAGTGIDEDDFVGTDGLVITTNTHRLDSGGVWTEHSSYASGTFIFDTNRARSSDATTGCYYSTATPTSADYYVETVIYQQGSTITGMGPAGRIDTASNTMYVGRFQSSSGQWQLLKLVAGASTTLGTYSASTSNGASYTVRLRMIGTIISLDLAGVEIISVSDSDIAGPGKAGIRGASQSGGHHIESFIAVNL